MYQSQKLHAANSKRKMEPDTIHEPKGAKNRRSKWKNILLTLICLLACHAAFGQSQSKSYIKEVINGKTVIVKAKADFIPQKSSEAATNGLSSATGRTLRDGNGTWTLSSTVTATLSNDGTLTISGTGEIPNYYSNILPPWNPSDIKRATITNGITSIGMYTFFNCASMTSVTIPNSVTRIEPFAFEGCRSLTSVVIPNSVTRIENQTFLGCTDLASVTIPNSVTYIGNMAFGYCQSLESVTIPNAVDSIGDAAFYGCENLSLVTMPSSLKSIGYSAFAYCFSLTSISIPNSVTSIGEAAFYSCTGLTSIDIPNSVRSIGGMALYNYNLLEINVDANNPNYSSQDGILFNKNKTTLIQYPAGKSGEYNIPESVISIEMYAFYICSRLTALTIPASVTTLLGDAPFLANISLTAINVDAGNPNYSSQDGILFNKNKTTLIQYPANQSGEYNIPTSVTAIANSAFDNSQLEKINIPNSVTSIGTGAFLGCNSFSSIVIPKLVSRIEEATFYSCDNLSSVTLPEAMTYIGAYAFESCQMLKKVYCFAVIPPAIEESAFLGVNIAQCILHVPENSISLYFSAPIWEDFEDIIAIGDDAVIDYDPFLGVKYPPSADPAAYKNLSLVLTLAGSDQQQTLTTTATSQYKFRNLAAGTYNLALKNKYGSILGEINGIAISEDKDTTVTFASLAPLYTVQLEFSGNQGLSGSPSAKWYDSDNNFIAVGNSIAGLAAGMVLKYQVELNEALGAAYSQPSLQSYTVTAGSNIVAVSLQPIQEITIHGKVTTESGTVLSGAIVTASQLINGKYNKVVSGKADADGIFSLTVLNAAAEITASYSGYFNRSTDISDFASTDIGTIALSPITGAQVNLVLSYSSNVAAGETPSSDGWYSNYQNIGYTLYNVSTGTAITDFIVQYPEIIIVTVAAAGEQIRITATSKADDFNPVQSTATIDDNLRASAEINIVQRGTIQATYTNSASAENIGILYDASGKLIKRYAYSGRMLTSDELPDGAYQLVSMSSNVLFNGILNLSEYSAAGLAQGTDYLLNTVTVRSGEISQVSVASIPALNESRLYYTGDNTYFSVNKTSGTAGNYLTLRAQIDFKSEYADKISNLKLIVDIPDECSFEHNSVMKGSSILSSTAYSYMNNQLTVALADYADAVRFCIIPVSAGDFSPGAFIEFDIDGRTIRQPIGSAPFTVQSLALMVPSVTAQKAIPVQGIAPAGSNVMIYDNDMLIGQTKALKDGSWALSCELNNPYAYSFHDIHAEVLSQGIHLNTEIKQVTYDATSVSLSKVTMLNIAYPHKEETTVFDFLNPSSKKLTYDYYPTYPDFTFKIEFTTTDPSKVSNVWLQVLTSAGNVESLPATYDTGKKLWVATGKFDSYHLPVNVNVDFVSETEPVLDSKRINDIYSLIADLKQIDSAEAEEIEYDEVEIDPSILNLSNEELLDYIDLQNEEFAYLIQEMDTLIGSLENYGYTAEDGSTVSVSIKDCAGINESQLANNGFIAYPKDDGTYIYVKTTEASYEYVDISANFYSCIKQTKPAVALRTMLDNIIWGGNSALKIWESVMSENLAKASTTGSSAYFLIKQLEVRELGEQGLIGLQKAHERFNTNQAKFSRIAGRLRWLRPLGNVLAGLFSYRDVHNTIARYDEIINEWNNLIALLNKNKCDRELMGILITKAESGRSRAVLDRNALVILSGSTALIRVPLASIALGAINLMLSGAWENDDRGRKMEIFAQIPVISCEEPDPKPTPKPTPTPPTSYPHPPVTGLIDPSGYVYEAVPSNRLQGVTATIFQKVTEDGVENIQLWDAAEYEQENPMLTDENGRYGWDVPVGLWQVKYEKDGYQTIYSEWLPVPPPQLEVNMAKVRNTPPSVTDAKGYESGIDITFDMFMLPADMNTDNITVKHNGSLVAGTVIMKDEETDPLSGKSFASKVRFVPTAPFSANDEVVLTVKKDVKSYAGISMTDDYVLYIIIRKDIASISVVSSLNISLHDQVDLAVEVQPGEAVAGMKIKAHSISSSIAGVTGEATLNAEGKALLHVSAELPGTTYIIIELEGTELKKEVEVNVNIDKTYSNTYSVFVIPSANGSVTAYPTTAAAGDDVTVTIAPNSGYELASFAINPPIPSSNWIVNTSSIKKFKMPASNITVQAFFSAIYTPTPDPDPDPDPDPTPTPVTDEEWTNLQQAISIISSTRIEIPQVDANTKAEAETWLTSYIRDLLKANGYGNISINYLSVFTFNEATAGSSTYANGSNGSLIFDLILANKYTQRLNNKTAIILASVYDPTAAEAAIAGISVSPVPARDFIFIHSDHPVKRIELYSLTGSLIFSGSAADRISVATLPSGIYLLRIYTDSGTVIRKIVKE
jgi:hypothetical protein